MILVTKQKNIKFGPKKIVDSLLLIVEAIYYGMEIMGKKIHI